MNGNYQISRFLANERASNYRKEAEAHRQAKLASESRINRFSANRVVEASYRMVEVAKGLVVRVENVLHPAVAQ